MIFVLRDTFCDHVLHTPLFHWSNEHVSKVANNPTMVENHVSKPSSYAFHCYIFNRQKKLLEYWTLNQSWERWPIYTFYFLPYKMCLNFVMFNVPGLPVLLPPSSHLLPHLHSLWNTTAGHTPIDTWYQISDTWYLISDIRYLLSPAGPPLFVKPNCWWHTSRYAAVSHHNLYMNVECSVYLQ